MLRIAITAIAVSLALSNARGNALMVMTETPSGLVVSFVGSQLTIPPSSGSPETFTFDLGAGFFANIQVKIGEPENPGLCNSITASPGSSILTWTSDIPSGGMTFPTSATILNAGITISGPPVFDLQVVDERDNHVPDGGATLALLGSALCGLAMLRRLTRANPTCYLINN